MPASTRSFSLPAALLVWLLAGIGIFQNTERTRFTWDSFGYHLYLPAAVAHHDPLMKDLGWVEQARKDFDASGTLYQISTLEDGAHVDKYTMGLAVLWSPWFLAGHVIAKVTGQPQDGYSPPYDLAVRAGVWLYLLLGLLALRAVLRSRFSDWIATLVLLLLFAATNLIDQATAGTAMPHITLFCLYACILWATLRWTEERRSGRALVLAVLMGLAMLVRPSEGVCVLLPFLWRGGNELPNPFKRAWQLRRQWIAIIAVMFLIGLPQFIYWKAATGHWFLDTYNNAGEGFDFLGPHTWPFLFSFRKGWYIYTPLMLLATAGIFLLRRSWREAFQPVLAFFLLNLFVLSSWTNWWYADSFGSRAMVGSYAVMALPLAAVLQWAAGGGRMRKWMIGVLLAACTALNLFQYWQFKHGIIHSSRMTWAAYKAGFGKTTAPANLEDLLLVYRSYSGEQIRPDSSKYDRVPMPELSALLPAPDTVFRDTSTGTLHHAYRLDGQHPFTQAMHVPFNELTTHDHAWIELEWQVFMPGSGTKGSFVTTFEHGGKNYAYMAEDIEKHHVPPGHWTTVYTWYLTPEVRNRKDLFVTYFWLRDTVPMYVSGPTITTYQPKKRD
ncbi:MAG: hypothetical protein JST45_14305 [Bacteroidetes bacterium]|nr:hypothetical protein [Bacteroidota bacterium]